MRRYRGLIIVIALLALLHIYIGLRLMEPLALDTGAAAAGWTMLAGSFVMTPVGLMAPRIRHWDLSDGLAWAGLLLALQVVLGGWVSTNYAVLACTTFPTCQGSWWPAMDFAQGFQIWRKLGLLQDGSHISFAALTAIHYVHRLMAYVVLLALGLVAWRFHLSGVLPTQARWIGGLALLQLVTGLSNVVLDWPLVAAVLHTGGAAALVVVLTWALVSSRAAPAPREFSAPTGASRVSA